MNAVLVYLLLQLFETVLFTLFTNVFGYPLYYWFLWMAADCFFTALAVYRKKTATGM